MTVCVAATCREGGRGYVVAASDRLHSASSEVSLEGDQPKAETFGKFLVLFAGRSSALATAIALAQLNERVASAPDTPAAARRIGEILSEERRREIHHAVLYPLGLDTNALLLAKDKKSVLAQTLSDRVTRMFNDVKAGPEMTFALVAGVDGDVPRVFSAGPLEVTSNPSIGFGSCGSGGRIASIYLTAHRHSALDRLHITLSRVLMAKRFCETASTVGTATDLFLVDSVGVRTIAPMDVSELRARQEKIEADMKGALLTDESTSRIVRGLLTEKRA